MGYGWKVISCKFEKGISVRLNTIPISETEILIFGGEKNGLSQS